MPDNDNADGILAKLEKILSRIPTTTNDDDPPEGKSVSYQRFYKANQRAIAAEAALKELGADVVTHKTTTAAQITSLQQETATTVAAMATTHQENIALIQAGFDDDGMAALRAAWGRQPEATRGEAPSKWWTQQVDAVKAHRADPEKAAMPEISRTLTSYVPAVAADTKADAPTTSAAQQPGMGGIRIGGNRSVDRNVIKGPQPTRTDKIGKAKTWAELTAAAEG